MADGNRSVRSAKYETPLYNKTQKTKYLIGLQAQTLAAIPSIKKQEIVINIINHKGNDMMLCDSFVIALKAATCEIIFISFEHFWKTIPSMHYNFMTDTSCST